MPARCRTADRACSTRARRTPTRSAAPAQLERVRETWPRTPAPSASSTPPRARIACPGWSSSWPTRSRSEARRRGQAAQDPADPARIASVQPSWSAGRARRPRPASGTTRPTCAPAPRRRAAGRRARCRSPRRPGRARPSRRAWSGASPGRVAVDGGDLVGRAGRAGQRPDHHAHALEERRDRRQAVGVRNYALSACGFYLGQPITCTSGAAYLVAVLPECTGQSCPRQPQPMISARAMKPSRVIPRN